ncbi:hypothetical protein [uncultured Draconibacterium sp.]|uniref:hypothetical protein n=1 Tax=uncultured Draconibacterium sp. TaxID=1573823 RepID=UPI00321766EB
MDYRMQVEQVLEKIDLDFIYHFDCNNDLDIMLNFRKGLRAVADYSDTGQCSRQTFEGFLILYALHEKHKNRSEYTLLSNRLIIDKSFYSKN